MVEDTPHMASAMSWSDLENADGVRFSFNCWPDDRQLAVENGNNGRRTFCHQT